MKYWFEKRTPRERFVLVGGTIALIAILGYFLGWYPFQQNYRQLQQMVAAEQATYLWMQQASAEVKRLQAQSTTATSKTTKEAVSILTLLDKELTQATFAKVQKRMESKGEREVQIDFTEISFTELVDWLGRLYSQYQIQVNSILLERLTMPDKVKVRMTLFQ